MISGNVYIGLGQTFQTYSEVNSKTENVGLVD